MGPRIAALHFVSSVLTPSHKVVKAVGMIPTPLRKTCIEAVYCAQAFALFQDLESKAAQDCASLLGTGFRLGFCEGPHFWAHGVQLLRAFVQCFVPWRGMTFGLALRVGRD